MIEPLSTLELKIAERRNGRKFLDFVVNKESVFDLVGYQFDTVSCIASWPNMEETFKSVDRLLLREPADFRNNRCSLYVCGECGGLDCGAVSLIIEEHEDTILWREFGHERDWENDLEKFEEIGPFVFNKEQYVKKLESSIQLLQNSDN
ncbi:MAG TPA: hypothetical protein VF627_13575 [Abditibacterium sp.]|jgi:hypothetical protein